jgi:glycosyltransferase involved in cell wall biosynthesis
LIFCTEKSTPLAFLKTDIPIVFWGDAPFDSLVNYYDNWSNLCLESLKNGNLLEKRALEKTDLLVYSSEWSADEAIRRYDISRKKTKVIEFGANFDSKTSYRQILKSCKKKSKKKCNLFILGVDWKRKGGEIALKIAKELNKRGLKTVLKVVGCEPEITMLPDFVKVIPYVDKSTLKGQKQLTKLFEESHFFILPSFADCTPLVLPEANSFGVPCISTKTGGIPTIIKDNVNGKLFSLNANISEYCDYIEDLFHDRKRYERLALNSFKEYKKRLNWDVAGRRLKKLLETTIKQHNNK